MKRPKINNQKVNDYIDYLERKLELFSNNSTRVKSFKALTKFVEENNKVIEGVVLSKEQVSDKDDKFIDRVMKFTDKLPDYIEALDKMAEKIDDEAKAEEEKKQQAASDYEELMG